MEHAWSWTTDQLRTAINLCESVCAKMVADGASPESIASHRQGIDVLYRLLEDSERSDLEKQREG